MNVICEHCDSPSFPSEKFNCCHDGKVHLDDHPFPPELQRFFETFDELSLHFRSNIRRYNTAFAFASLTAKLDPPPPPPPPVRGPPVFRICGQLYHNYASLYPNNNNHPSFNQLYIYEPSEANNIRRLNPVTGECRPNVTEIIADILHNRNPYARFYRTMAEVERRERESAAAQNLPPPVVSMHMRIVDGTMILISMKWLQSSHLLTVQLMLLAIS